MDWQVINQLIQNKSLLNHKFYVAWSQGQLTLSDLQFYAGQYYGLEATFPRLLSRVHSACDNPDVREGILDNLNDEEQGEKNHRKLWLRFAQGLGLDSKEVMTTAQHPSTKRCIERLSALAANADPVVGLAALYAYESQLPAVSQSKIDGLKRFYGIDDEQTIEFFTVHKQADVWHAQQEQKMLDDLGASMDKVVPAVEEACDALLEFLDGVDESTRLKRLGVDGVGECCH